MMFFRLFCGTVWMLASGYCGEAGFCNATMAFVSGLAGWFYILYEIFSGEAGKESGSIGGHVKAGFDTMKFIRHHWLVNLPAWLLLWLLGWRSQCLHTQPGVQPCRFREQDWILPCHLELRQEGH